MSFLMNIEEIEKIKRELGNIRPVRKYGVFLVLDEILREEKTPGGLIVLHSYSEGLGYRMATVLSTGVRTTVKPGDRIVIGKYYGKAFDIQPSMKCKLIYISEDQIDAIEE